MEQALVVSPATLDATLDVKEKKSFDADMLTTPSSILKRGGAKMARKSEAAAGNAPIEEARKRRCTVGSWFAIIPRVILETVSLMDLITDVSILLKMAQAGHMWWSVITICTIVAPYLVGYACLLSLFIFKKTFEHHTLLGLLYLSPVCLVHFACIEAYYILATACEILCDLLAFFTCGFIRFQIDADKLPQTLGLSMMDVMGYRRLRTISQLTFESLPQLILQSHIISSGLASSMGLSPMEVYGSVFFAVTHTVAEAVVLWHESTAWKEGFVQYSLTCLTGRLGWLPFETHLKHKECWGKEFNYASTASLLCMEVENDFEFSDTTMQKLVEAIYHLPVREKSYVPPQPSEEVLPSQSQSQTHLQPQSISQSQSQSLQPPPLPLRESLQVQEMPVLVFKRSCKLIEWERILDFLVASENRCTLDLEGYLQVVAADLVLVCV
jgi:hypothetical protein